MGEPNPAGAAGTPAASRPRLGELLVQRGLLTQEQLGAALAEQQASGSPLGAILVRDGLVASHTIAILLAEQSGGPLKTEFGYAVGAASAEPAGADVLALHPPTSPTSDFEPPVSELPLDGLRLATPEPPPVAPAIEPVQALRQVTPDTAEVAPEWPAPEPKPSERDLRWEQEREALEARVGELEMRAEAAAAVRAALEAKVNQLEARAEEAVAARAALEEKLAELETRAEQPVAAPTALEQKLTDLETRAEAAVAARTALEHEVATLRARTDEAEAHSREAESLHAALRDRLAALEVRAEQSDAVRASAERSITGRPYTSERHILLAPVGDRYELVERPGPAPEVGCLLDLFGDRSFRVVRVGPAPIPGALEACAYLEPVHVGTHDGIPTPFPPPDADTELT